MGSFIPSHSSANRVVDSDLVVSYSRVRIFGKWQYVLPGGITTMSTAWQYTRTATKTYRYVGMDLSGATACKTAMISKYLRSTTVSTWDPVQSISEFTDISGGQVQMAEVSVRHVGGEMYEVVVNVRETDSRLRFGIVSFSSLFSSEESRDYDTGA